MYVTPAAQCSQVAQEKKPFSHVYPGLLSHLNPTSTHLGRIKGSLCPVFTRTLPRRLESSQWKGLENLGGFWMSLKTLLPGYSVLCSSETGQNTHRTQ